MTRRGRINGLTGNAPVSWSNGVSATAGTIYTDFPNDAVARLRAANEAPKADAKPWRRKDRPEMSKKKKTVASMSNQSELENIPSPPKPSVTMDAFKGKGNHEKGAFIRRHFPDWLAHQHEHGLTRKQMMALTGVASSVWYNHSVQYRKNPERYGAQTKPALTPKKQVKPAPVVETVPEEAVELDMLDELDAPSPTVPMPDWLKRTDAIASPSPLSGDLPTAVGKVRQLATLVNELRAAGAVVEGG
jgi:hypothetical protein